MVAQGVLEMHLLVWVDGGLVRACGAGRAGIGVRAPRTRRALAGEGAQGNLKGTTRGLKDVSGHGLRLATAQPSDLVFPG